MSKMVSYPSLLCRCCKYERYINPNHPKINCWRCKDHVKSCRTGVVETFDHWMPRGLGMVGQQAILDQAIHNHDR